jgi:hypothetical protein
LLKYLNNQQIEQVSEFSYLGSIISKDNGGTGRDVVERIKKARGAFGEIRLQGKTWNEVKVLDRNRVGWRNFVRALCSREE